ncbi:MAG: hypothetical protein KGQ61_08470 [Planctomycetes bacterium]|nr:hypothetical protein [Planctomycetota bacterium]
MATFDVDATPPVGARMAYEVAIRDADLPLRCRGVVIVGSGAPIVLCAIDWIGIGNGAHDAFREALAAAAGTSADRVAVHALHQHDAPQADFTAEKLLADLGATGHERFDGTLARAVIARAAAAIRAAVPEARPLTSVGFGRAEVAGIASNRRLVGADGKLRAWRASATKDPALRAEPDGTIDPFVTALVLSDGATPLAVLTAYATHPMSYYRTAVPGPDFPGIARLLRTQDVPTALHVHFTGAAGNVAAGKYNDGNHANRVILATRLATGMRQAFEAAVADRRPLTAADVGFAAVPVALAARGDLDRVALEAKVRDGSDRGTFAAADTLAFLERAGQGHAIPVTCLRIGGVRMLHLPGELFVEYQLLAQSLRPDLHVMLAAYGDYGPGYIGTARAYDEGGYEVLPTSSFVGPEAEARLVAAIRTLLEVKE